MIHAFHFIYGCSVRILIWPMRWQRWKVIYPSRNSITVFSGELIMNYFLHLQIFSQGSKTGDEVTQMEGYISKQEFHNCSEWGVDNELFFTSTDIQLGLLNASSEQFFFVGHCNAFYAAQRGLGDRLRPQLISLRKILQRIFTSRHFTFLVEY